MVHLALGKHSVVFELRLFDRRSVRRDENKLRLAGSQALDGRAVAQGVLSGLDDERQTRVHVLSGLLLALHHLETSGVPAGNGVDERIDAIASVPTATLMNSIHVDRFALYVATNDNTE